MHNLSGILGLLFFVAVGVTAVGAGYLVIGPLYRQVRKPRRKLTFYVIDFIALLALVQFALAGFLSFLHEALQDRWWGVAILIAIAVFFVWWASVDVLSQLGIRAASRRLVMHLLILPGVCGVMALTAMIFLMTQRYFLPSWSADQRTFDASAILTLPLMIVLFPTVLASIWLFRSIAVWLVHEVRDDALESQ